MLWGVLLPLVVAGVAVSAVLIVRRRAPEGSYFNDGDRAAGMFGVLTTGFSVLLGFVVFLAFASYDQSRTGAEAEALTVAQQFQTAQFMPAKASGPLGAELICYGRYVVGTEWPQMEAGAGPSEVNPWGLRLFRTLQTVQPQSASEQAAYSKWLDQTSDREQARQDRLHGAEGIIPSPLWAALIVIAIVIGLFMLFFADSGEAKLVQAAQVGSVTIVIVLMLLLIRFLDNPFQSGPGGLQPTSMTRTLSILEGDLKGVGNRTALPCNGVGAPT